MFRKKAVGVYDGFFYFKNNCLFKIRKIIKLKLTLILFKYIMKIIKETRIYLKTETYLYYDLKEMKVIVKKE